jgi:hypothetical protein
MENKRAERVNSRSEWREKDQCMETQVYIEYECSNPVTDEVYKTRDLWEATDFFKDGWTVYEIHVTVTIPSPFVSTREEVTMLWNNNPHVEV